MTALSLATLALLLSEVWIAACVDSRSGRVPNHLNATFLILNLAVAGSLGWWRLALVWSALSVPAALVLHRLGLGGGDLKLVLSTCPLGGPIPWLALAAACVAGYLRGGRLSALDLAAFTTVLAISTLL